MGESMPDACQDWANTKAAYRFFDNENISEQEILSGHLESTKKRLAATQEPIFILHDITKFSFKRNETGLIGYTSVMGNGKKAYGHFKRHTLCGLLMPASLAVTTRGLPVSLTAIKF
jgi:hypothetical protein